MFYDILTMVFLDNINNFLKGQFYEKIKSTVSQCLSAEW